MSSIKGLLLFCVAVASTSSVPSLATVRDTLALSEDSIIAALLSRAKLPVSSTWYNEKGDFIQYLQEFEESAASIGRYDI